MPLDVVAMIAQHRRERASELSARAPRRWWSRPLDLWVSSKFALREVVTLAMHPEKAFEVSRKAYLILLALAAIAVTGIARLAPMWGILVMIGALSAWAGMFLRAEWRKGQKSPFFIIILPWILIPVLVFVLPLALAIASIIYIIWFWH
jgi:hypothetical protein